MGGGGDELGEVVAGMRDAGVDKDQNQVASLIIDSCDLVYTVYSSDGSKCE